MKQTVFIFIILFSVSLSIFAESERVVRFWEGQKHDAISYEEHMDYIANTLMPATIVTGLDSLTHYVVYIPPSESLPKEAYLRELSFSEAAIPTYINREVYSLKNERTPEYGPLHFVSEGFDRDFSFSATPIPYRRSIEIAIATKSNRVAYDLRPYAQIEKEIGSYEPDWKKGTTPVLLQLRRKEASEAVYLDAIREFMNRFTHEGGIYPEADGHFARVSEGHILHFINVPNKENISSVVKKISRIFKSKKTLESLMSFDLTISESFGVFEKGWRDSVAEGRAINVQF